MAMATKGSAKVTLPAADQILIEREFAAPAHLVWRAVTEPELADQVADRPLLVGQQIDDLPPARLGHRVERVGRGRCSGHADKLHTHMGMCQGRTGRSARSRNPTTRRS